MRKESLPLKAKKEISIVVIREAMTGSGKPAILWTGGKDSTLVLYFTIEAASAAGSALPTIVFVDHGQHFPETSSFMTELADRQDLRLVVARNENVFNAAGGAQSVPLRALDARNQEEALKAGLEGSLVSLSLDSPVGNHLLKTVALNRCIEALGLD